MGGLKRKLTTLRSYKELYDRAGYFVEPSSAM